MGITSGVSFTLTVLPLALYVHSKDGAFGNALDAEMAEAIVQFRAIYLSGDFDRYWSFHIAKDQQRLHPGHWSVVLK
jgi:hypothetical protein